MIPSPLDCLDLLNFLLFNNPKGKAENALLFEYEVEKKIGGHPSKKTVQVQSFSYIK
jgi:hypothetical protein